MLSTDSRAPELLELLGQGTIGETWVARLPDGSVVAEKRVRCGDAATRNQLLGRLARLEPLTVPSLAPVRHVRQHGDEVWVSTDLDDGLTLRRLLRVATLTPGQAVAIGREVLQGLFALHDAGLCHGAVHAGNVYIAAHGRVRLGDGGLIPLVRRRGRVREARCRHSDVASALAIIRETMDSERQGQRELALSTSLRERLDTAIAGLDWRNPGAAEPAEVMLEALVAGAGRLAGEEAQSAARVQLAALVRSVGRPRQRFPAAAGRPSSEEQPGRERLDAAPPPRPQGPAPSVPGAAQPNPLGLLRRAAAALGIRRS